MLLVWGWSEVQILMASVAAGLIKSADAMWKQSVWTSVVASSLAARHLKQGGVLTLPGAQPSLGGTPGNLSSVASTACVILFTCLVCDWSSELLCLTGMIGYGVRDRCD